MTAAPLVRELIDLLESEFLACAVLEQKSRSLQESLVRDDLPLMTQTLEEEEILFAKLSAAEERRQQIMARIGAPEGAGPARPVSLREMTEWLASQGVENAGELARKFSALVERIMRLNRTNSMLARDSLEKCNLFIQWIHNSRSPAVYNRNGQCVARPAAPRTFDHRG